MELLAIYPNPAQDYVYISLGNAAEYRGQIKVMDLSGREVLDVEVDPGQSIRPLDISSLSGGVFLVNWVESGLVKGRAKFVIAR